ncbi:MAG: type IV secretory system conjugative DNA transfer family protein [Thermomicrobiales bacterium]
MNGKRTTLFGLLASVLAAAGIGAVIVGPTVAVRVRVGLRAVELAAAYPALRLDEEIVALTSASTTGSSPGGAGTTHQTGFKEWFDQPIAARWQQYMRPDHTRVRRIARSELALFALGLVAILVRTVGRGFWFLLMILVMRRHERPSTSHGSARWASVAECAALRPRPGHADLVVGRIGRRLVAIPERDQYEHLLLVAPTGAGKTSGVILPNLLSEPGTRSLVITDPKRELLRKSSSAIRARYGDDHVWTLDFLDPILSRGYNPLAYVTDAATADLFAQTWVRNTGESKDAFWSNAARTLIGAATLHLVATEEITPPLVALVDLLCGTPAETVRATLAASPVPEVRRLARGFLANMAKNERLLGSVFTELPPRFTCLNLAEVRAVTGTNEIAFARLARHPTALYLALDPQYSRTLAPLTACFFLHFFTTLTSIAKNAASGALPVPVLAYLDEFGTVGHIPEFAARMATVRSAGIGCLLVVQDKAQLTKAYGEEDADTIVSNATTKMCLGRVTHDDAEYFSKLAGTTTVYSANRSASRPLLIPWADRGNRGVGEAQRALITPDELRTMRDEVFIVAGHQHPIRARQRRYYDDPALVRLLPDPNRPDPLIDLHRAVALPVPMVEPTLEVVAPEDDDIAPPSSTREGDTMSMPSTGADGHGAVLPDRAETVPIHAPARNEELTEAEIALLAAMVAAPGASSATLATSLRVAASTVRKRQGAVRTKLGGMDGDLVRLAQERGALPLVTMVAEDTGASSVEDV